jgi:hypothetical protein
VETGDSLFDRDDGRPPGDILLSLPWDFVRFFWDVEDGSNSGATCGCVGTVEEYSIFRGFMRSTLN